MYQKKDIERFFKRAVLLALTFSVAFLLSLENIRIYIKPIVLEFVEVYGNALLLFMFYVFLASCSLLVFIVWWLEWGDKKQERYVSKYISQLVCQNYYGDYRKTNVYKAIKTCLSKFSRDTLEDDEESKNGPISRMAHEQEAWFHKDEIPLKKSSEIPENTTDGTHRTYHKNGRLEREVTYQNGVMQGAYRTYYDDGKAHQEKFFKDGKLDGVFKAYDEEGILYFDISYKEGKQDGIMNSYYKSGILEYSDMYKDGKMIWRKTYSTSGELMFQQKYVKEEEIVPQSKKQKKYKRKFPKVTDNRWNIDGNSN